MEELNTIYKQMDNEFLGDNFISKNNITQKLIKIRNETENQKLIKTSQIEIDCLEFYLEEGKLEPTYKIISADGTERKIPNLDLFDKDYYTYIQKRIENTSNKHLKSRYCMVIVEGKRDNKYAQKLININLSIIKELEEKLSKENIDTLLEYILNTYIIATKFKYGKEKIEEVILNIVKNPSYNNTEFYNLKLNLIEFMLKEKKKFKVKYDLKELNSLCWELLKDLENKKIYYSILYLSGLGIKIENKLKDNHNDWKMITARTYENMALEHENKLAKQCLLLKSMNLYKEIKNKNKIEELTEIYDNVKEANNPNKVSIKIEGLNKIFKELNNRANEISSDNYLIIINELMHNYNILVGRHENFEEFVENNHRRSILFYIQNMVFDKRGNILKKYKTNNEKKEFLLNFNYYTFFISEICSFYLNQLLILSISKGNLTAQNILEFIENETWLGNKKGGKLSFDYLSILSKIINKYFLEINAKLKHSDRNPQFDLPMSTLVLKIEGIIRDMCKSLDISTTHIKNGESEEKNLNLLLKEDKLKEFIGKDDIFYLKYLLIDKKGKNLRNEIAHSLLPPQSYNINNMNLVLLALFRLIKYEFK